MFACEHYDVAPDMLVIGKGLGGGVFPLAALIARAELDVAADRALGHYTHEKDPVACAAALATIETLEQEGLLERSRELGERSLARLGALRARYPDVVTDVRGLGLLLGVELAGARPGGGRVAPLAEAVLYEALARGLSFKVSMGNVITLAPPLTITEPDLGRAMDILDASLGAASA